MQEVEVASDRDHLQLQDEIASVIAQCVRLFPEPMPRAKDLEGIPLTRADKESPHGRVGGLNRVVVVHVEV